MSLQGTPEPHVLWITRRQCIEILLACRSRMAREVIETTSLHKRRNDQELKPEQPTPAPELPRLSLRQLPNGLRLNFQFEDKPPLRLMMRIEDLPLLEKNIARLAVRAHWEIEVACAHFEAKTVLRRLGAFSR